MAAYESSYTHSFYLYLPTICDVGVYLPFSSFEAKVLIMLNVAPSQPHSDCSLIKAFEILYRQLGSYPTIVIFSFYGTRAHVRRGWVTLDILLERALFQGWNDNLMRMTGRIVPL